jgi:capsule polysaccharide export protein KpsE/RkpR
MITTDANLYALELSMTSESSIIRRMLSPIPIVKVFEPNGNDYSSIVKFSMDENVYVSYADDLSVPFDYVRSLVSVSRSANDEEDDAFEKYLDLFEVQ